MDEYIERENAIAWFIPYAHAGESIDADVVISDIKGMKAADVAPVRHARWEYERPTINTYGMVKCTVCNWWTIDPSVSTVYHYCPNCGAKMDG